MKYKREIRKGKEQFVHAHILKFTRIHVSTYIHTYTRIGACAYELVKETLINLNVATITIKRERTLGVGSCYVILAKKELRVKFSKKKKKCEIQIIPPFLSTSPPSSTDNARVRSRERFLRISDNQKNEDRDRRVFFLSKLIDPSDGNKETCWSLFGYKKNSRDSLIKVEWQRRRYESLYKRKLPTSYYNIRFSQS